MNGHNIDQELILSEDQALPNNTSADSTNMVKVGGKTGQKLSILVYATTDIDVLSAKVASIELQAFTADTAASAVSPIANAHVYGLHKTADDGAIDLASGDLVCEIPIPETLFAENDYTWVQLVYSTDDNLSTMKVNAFVSVIA